MFKNFQKGSISSTFEQDEKLFSAHSVWQTANKFGKECANLSLKFGVLIVVEIERQKLPIKTLMKMTPGVDFISILCDHFVLIFWHQK